MSALELEDERPPRELWEWAFGVAVVAVRTGNLTRSIFLHVGFNALGAISLLTSKVH